MYLDNRNTLRERFTFLYSGRDMLPHVKIRLAEMIVKEKQAREEIIRLTRDSSVGPDDRKMQEAKKEVVAVASIVEELSVYVTEFERNQTREFTLSSGDVVFLGLISSEVNQLVESGIAPCN